MGARRLLCLCCLISLCFLGLGACAKTGDPEPPVVLVPRPAADLAARQYSARILLTLSPPTQNTNGSRVTNLSRVELFRLAGGRLNTGTIPDEVFLGQAEQILVIPADQLSRYQKDGRLAFWDEPAADPAAFYAQGFHYAARFINRRNQTAGLSNQTFIAPVAIPAAPEGLAYELFRDHVQLTWKPPEKNMDGSVPPRIAGYNVYRSEDPKTSPDTPINAEPLAQSEFDDRSYEADKTYYYAVSVVGSKTNPYAESAPTVLLPVRTQDIFPPGPPKELAALAENGVVTLLWGPPDDPDLAGYRVYRTEEGAAERILLQEQLVTAFSFRDDKVGAGKKYEYSVVAVDTHGNVSPAAITTVEVR